jgi:DNA polymerase-3 subunit alpha
VATNDCHYLTADDAHAHDILLCIQTGKTVSDAGRMKFGSEEFYLKSEQEMLHIFRSVPEAVRLTQEIAARCNVKLDRVENPFPPFQVPEGRIRAASAPP